MTNANTGGDTVEGSPATATLERLVDPVIAVTEGTVTYANGAAREAFDLEGTGEHALGDVLEDSHSIAAEIDETTVGTSRHVSLDGTQYDGRIHRAESGATVVFTSRATADSARDTATATRDGQHADLTQDRAVKERALEEAPVGITISDPDREDNPLVYVNDAYQEVTGYSYDDVIGRNCRLLQGEDSDSDAITEMAIAIAEERPVTVELKNYRKDGTEFWNEVTIAPVRDAAGTVTHYVGFQNDISARKEAELALEDRTAELEYLLERVEGLVQDVTAAVAGAADRSTLERAVCDRIAAEAAYDDVWIGERNPATGTIDVRAGAGSTPESIEVDASHPAAEALETGEIARKTVATDADASTAEPTHAAYPLTYNEIEYGVLSVRTVSGQDIGDREAVIFSALARAIASGINARETSRVLTTDAVVAIDLELTDSAVAPVALSASADCRLEYRRSVHQSGSGELDDGDTATLFTVSGASADTLTEAAASLSDIDCRVVVDREDDDECVVELSGGDDPVFWLSERGVRVTSIDCEDGRARLSLEIPRSANVRTIIDALEERHPGTDVRSFQQRDRSAETRQEFAARLEDELTERQLTVLQRAYLGGYFEWPRPVTGEDLAQSMNVSRPTFHEHLRTAEAKLCRAFFDGEYTSD